MKQAKVIHGRSELVRVSDLKAHPKNPRKGNVQAISTSIDENGFYGAVVAQKSTGFIIVGRHRWEAAKRDGLAKIPVFWADVSDDRALRIMLADNRTNDLATYDNNLLASDLKELNKLGSLAGTGFDDAALTSLLADLEKAELQASLENNTSAAPEEEIPEVPPQPVTQSGDIWMIGKHRLICGDCRNANVVKELLGGVQANLVITSPPYAAQREYDPTSGFKPVPPEEYIEWFRDVAANTQSVLAPDGSYLLNIKEHAEDGERHLYVKDLVIAHKRNWGWRFVDEFCWRKTDDGVPGGWPNRFKNAWEPMFHFCRQQKIKFRAKAVGHLSDCCFEYSVDNPKSTSGSGLLGRDGSIVRAGCGFAGCIESRAIKDKKKGTLLNCGKFSKAGKTTCESKGDPLDHGHAR